MEHGSSKEADGTPQPDVGSEARPLLRPWHRSRRGGSVQPVPIIRSPTQATSDRLWVCVTLTLSAALIGDLIAIVVTVVDGRESPGLVAVFGALLSALVRPFGKPNGAKPRGAGPAIGRTRPHTRPPSETMPVAVAPRRGGLRARTREPEGGDTALNPGHDSREPAAG